MTDTSADGPDDGQNPGRFAAFRHRSFVLYFLARVFTTFGAQILSIAVIWHIYDLTKSALFTGLVGLVQFLPLALLVLVTGTAADQFGRRMIMGLSILLAAACGLAMLTASVAMPEFRHGASHTSTLTPPVIMSTAPGTPVAGTLTAPEPVESGHRLQFRIPDNAFTDPNGDPLVYSATKLDGSPLPAWLTFDPATRTLAGTPSFEDRGATPVRITATDPGGASAVIDFRVHAVHFTAAYVMLGILVIFGVARAFLGPASSSLVVSLVPNKDFANAVTWNSSAWQAATIIGPAAGGLLVGFGPDIAYGGAFVMMGLGALLVFAIPKLPKAAPKERPTLHNMLEGFRFIWKQKIILGAISLDLFAVLMGGVVALLPIYAEDILHLGPEGLGWLRAAPAIGAIAMAGVIAAYPIKDHAGRIMFICVALFGIFTVVFGVSTVAWLSITALIMLGAADMVSVVVRETLLQLWTPDAVRGRVNAVNSVFVSASNELGEFRAGTMAHALGPAAIGAVPAVVIGGVGAIVVAGAWAWMFPSLRNARRLDGEDVKH
ncbi:MAG TPA: MFS transporter [Hyphomonadaceae bacterium]|nr:MFS transporter [Hyphomonadaceae bacterium]HPN05344.1 MFS transporter [Hyphomonadaceae bacterium]